MDSRGRKIDRSPGMLDEKPAGRQFIDSSAANIIDSRKPVENGFVSEKKVGRGAAEKKGEEKQVGEGKGQEAVPDDEAKLTRLERAAKCIPGLGIMMSLCASLFLGSAGMLVKLTTSVHGIEVAVLRNAIQFLIYAAIITARGIRWTPIREEFYPVATRAFLGSISITLSYSAFKLIPLGDATTIRFSLPIWTLIMSYFFLRESCNLFKIFAVVISTSGVLLVAKPDMCIMLLHRLLNCLQLESDVDLALHQQAYEQTRAGQELGLILDDAALVAGTGHHANLTQHVKADPSDTANAPAPLTYSPDPVHQLEGCLMALTASIFLSIAVIALRLSKRTPAEVCILWLSLSTMIVGSTMLVVMGKWSIPNNWLDVLYILLNGACGAVGQWFMTSSLKIEQSGVIAVARTVDIEVAFLYSAFLLGEEIRMTSVLGSILVSLGVVSVVLPKWLGCSDEDTAANEAKNEVPITLSSPSDNSSTYADDHLTNMTTSTSAGDTIGRTGTGTSNNLADRVSRNHLNASHLATSSLTSGRCLEK